MVKMSGIRHFVEWIWETFDTAAVVKDIVAVACVAVVAFAVVETRQVLLVVVTFSAVEMVVAVRDS